MLLHEILSPYRLILATGSPRRHELMRMADLPFLVAEKYEVDETPPQGMASGEVPAYLSVLKSEGYPCELVEGDVLITADTVVICEGELIGKPEKGRAVETLRKINGREHRVVTGVTLRSLSRTHTFTCTSKVTFEKLTEEELEYYAQKYTPYDKAGAYGIQEWIGCVGISSIEGSFYNVMGLPVNRLYKELREFVGSC